MWAGQLPNGTNIHDVSLWYDFRNLAVDRSYNVNDGTISGATLVTTDVNDGLSYDFDGSNDVITVSAHTSINYGGTDAELSDGFTIECWVDVDSDGEANVGQIIEKGTNNYLRVTNEGSDKVKLEALVDHATTNASAIDNGTLIDINTNTHIAMVYNEDLDKKIKLYVDGALLALSTDTAGDGTITDDSGDDLLIGGTTAANYDGCIGPIRVWKKPLSIEMIGQIYNKFKV